MLSRHQFCSLFSTGLPSLYWGDKLCSLVPHCDFANRGSYKYLLQLLSMSGSYVKMEDSCGYGTVCEQVTVLCVESHNLQASQNAPCSRIQQKHCFKKERQLPLRAKLLWNEEDTNAAAVRKSGLSPLLKLAPWSRKEGTFSVRSACSAELTAIPPTFNLKCKGRKKQSTETHYLCPEALVQDSGILLHC